VVGARTGAVIEAEAEAMVEALIAASGSRPDHR